MVVVLVRSLADADRGDKEYDAEYGLHDPENELQKPHKKSLHHKKNYQNCSTPKDYTVPSFSSSGRYPSTAALSSSRERPALSADSRRFPMTGPLSGAAWMASISRPW